MRATAAITAHLQDIVFAGMVEFIGGGILSVRGLNLLFPFAIVDMQQMQWIQAIRSTLSQVLCILMTSNIGLATKAPTRR